MSRMSDSVLSDSVASMSLRVDSLWRMVIVSDSVSRRDSTVTVIKGDTVMIDRWHWLEAWHGNASDTGHASAVTDKASRIAEVHVTETVTETVEKPMPLTWWQRALMWAGGVSLVPVAWRLGRGICKLIRPDGRT